MNYVTGARLSTGELKIYRISNVEGYQQARQAVLDMVDPKAVVLVGVASQPTPGAGEERKQAA